jgi:hypothetical protein
MATLLNMVTIVAQVLVQQTHENGFVTTVTNLYSSWTYVKWRKFCIQFRRLKVHYFSMI